MIELVGLSLPALSKVVMEGGFPKFRAKQIMDYIYQRHIFSMDEMLQLPQGMRTWLQAHCIITVPTVVKESTSSDGNTKKLLLMAIQFAYHLRWAVPWVVFFVHLLRKVYFAI